MVMSVSSPSPPSNLAQQTLTFQATVLTASLYNSLEVGGQQRENDDKRSGWLEQEQETQSKTVGETA